MASNHPQPYENIPNLLAEVDKLHERITEKYPEKTKLALTAKKMVELREWEPALPLIKNNLLLLSELNVSFIPKVMRPGPCFLFPIPDLGGEATFAQVKPLEGSCIPTKAKYHFMGEELRGPKWMGATTATLIRIIATRKVVIVEGAFDYLACKLLCPDVPILSPLTKKLSLDKHVPYLRMLGVKDIYLMYDNEASGIGNKAMAIETRTLGEWFTVHTLLCPASDPSECLKSLTVAGKLKRMLNTIGAPPPTVVIDMD
jgi:hypothetical protein